MNEILALKLFVVFALFSIGVPLLGALGLWGRLGIDELMLTVFDYFFKMAVVAIGMTMLAGAIYVLMVL